MVDKSKQSSARLRQRLGHLSSIVEHAAPPGQSPPRPEKNLAADVVVLTNIATGLIHLMQRVERGQSLALPYPPPLQRGLNQLSLLCLQRGCQAPTGLPDLIQWCRRPLAQWPLRIEEGALTQHDVLLKGNLPTSTCDAWACENPDVEAELSETQVIKAVLDTCHAQQDQAAYISFRRLLIEQPALTQLEFFEKIRSAELHRLELPLKEAYEPAPLAFVKDGEFLCCPHCQGLLMRTIEDRWHCERERCRARGGRREGRRLPARDQVLWLRRGLRRFVSTPGQAELRLAHRLEKMGLRVELWPSFDRYDLRVHFPHGSIWGVDVKDWANPFLLARRVKAFPVEPRWDAAFFVFPTERERQRRDYVRAFSNHCPHLVNGVEAASERQFLQRVRACLAGRSAHA